MNSGIITLTNNVMKATVPAINGVKIKPTAELQTPNGLTPKMKEEKEEEHSSLGWTETFLQ